MADFGKALPYVLAQEVTGWPKDSEGKWVEDIAAGMAHVVALGRLHFWFTETPGDRGGATAWGLTLKDHPSIGSVDDLRQITAEKVAQIYRAEYWRFDGLTDQAVATKLMDLCVNTGPRTGVHMAQAVLVELGVPLKEDGIYGPHTETAINASAPSAVLRGLAAEAADYYHAIVEHSPDQQKFLADWLRRAEEIPT